MSVEREKVGSQPLSRTASDLRRLPKDQRDAIMEEAARIAEEVYRNDPSLTDFEAFETEESHHDDATTRQG